MVDADLRDVVLAEPPLHGVLGVPDRPLGVVVFAHGTGSSGSSPRNNAVAEQLRQAGIATLLFDLQTAAEQRAGDRSVDLAEQAERLAAALAWVRDQPRLAGRRIGLFGSSTGAALALTVAARPSSSVAAVVSRGGRPDLVPEALSAVRAPTLLVVGENDAAVLGLNQETLARLGCEKRLAVIPGAGHLFEEPGALDAVARLATEWFRRHLTGTPAKEET